MSKATPREWTVHIVRKTRYDSFTGEPSTKKQVWVKKGDGEFDHAALMTGDSEEANAELIVRAVNNFDSLVAMVSEYSLECPCKDGGMPGCEQCVKAKGVLIRARGQEGSDGQSYFDGR